MAQPAFPNSLFAGANLSSTTSNTTTAANSNITTVATTSSPNNTFLMSASPVRNRKSSAEGYKPKIITTVGAKPACLVNASVTYVGNEQIYAFGGFDQYTDEGKYRYTMHAAKIANAST